MRLVFEGGNDTEFALGSVSFDILNSYDVFDKYQQNTDEHSNVILDVLSDDSESLSLDIDNVIVLIKTKGVREDMINKIIKFSIWIKSSKGFKAFIK